MTDWSVVLLGLAILVLALSERGEIGDAWRRPAQWWSRDMGEGWEPPVLAQPGTLIIGVPVGVGAILYGMANFLT